MAILVLLIWFNSSTAVDEETMKEFRTAPWHVNVILTPEKDYFKNKIRGYRGRQMNKQTKSMQFFSRAAELNKPSFQ